MKTFEEIINEKSLSLADEILINQILEMTLSEIGEVESLEIHESEKISEEELVELENIVSQYGDTKLRDIDEGIIGKVLGGIAGFVVGPTIGKVVANSLGIEKGIIYDMFTSRLVSAALGSAITKYIGGSR